MAADTGVVGGSSSGIRNLRRHIGLSGNGAADGAAVAAIDKFERPEQCCLSANTGERIQSMLVDYRQYICGRSELSRGLCTELAVSRANRSACGAADDGDLSWDQRDAGSSGVFAEYISSWRHESMPDVPCGLCLSHLQWKLDT